MSLSCFNCGKGLMRGSTHRHRPGVAGRQHMHKVVHTAKIFGANLHTAYLKTENNFIKVKLCTKCRRLLIKAGKVRSYVPYSGMVKKKPEVAPTVKKQVVEKPKKVVTEAELDTALKKVLKGEESQAKKVEKETKKAEDKVSVEELVGKK